MGLLWETLDFADNSGIEKSTRCSRNRLPSQCVAATSKFKTPAISEHVWSCFLQPPVCPGQALSSPLPHLPAPWAPPSLLPSPPQRLIPPSAFTGGLGVGKVKVKVHPAGFGGWARWLAASPCQGLAPPWHTWKDTWWGSFYLLQYRSQGHPRWRSPCPGDCPPHVGCRSEPAGRGS